MPRRVTTRMGPRSSCAHRLLIDGSAMTLQTQCALLHLHTLMHTEVTYSYGLQARNRQPTPHDSMSCVIAVEVEQCRDTAQRQDGIVAS